MADHPFEQQLGQAWDPSTWCEVNTLVAVSGGSDSVALLLALHRLRRPSGGQLLVAHFNHQLRGEESDQDEQFVLQICRRLGVECHVGAAPGPTRSTGDGLEAEARDQRYAFFRQIADQTASRFLATAHTADDQAETILHRILRGTGITGLGGMPFVRTLSEMTTIVRPILSVSRSAVCDYLRDRGQPFREDSSNNLSIFTRNRIRHEILPMLSEQLNLQVTRSLLRLGELAREVQEVVDDVVEPIVETVLVRCTMTQAEICRLPLKTLRPYVIREVLMRIWTNQQWPRQEMSQGKWSALCELVQSAESDVPGFTLPGGVHAQVCEDRLILSRC
jgi:tRNA(Ile)-lysidine synthase